MSTTTNAELSELRELFKQTLQKLSDLESTVEGKLNEHSELLTQIKFDIHVVNKKTDEQINMTNAPNEQVPDEAKAKKKNIKTYFKEKFVENRENVYSIIDQADIEAVETKHTTDLDKKKNKNDREKALSELVYKELTDQQKATLKELKKSEEEAK